MPLTASSLGIGRWSRASAQTVSARPANNMRGIADTGWRLAEAEGFDPLVSIPAPKSGLLGRAAVNLQLGVFVQGAFGAAFGVETNVTGFHAFGVDQLAFVGFKVFTVAADAQARGVVRVVVEDGADVINKVGIIGHLHNDVMIDLSHVVGVPDHDGEDLLGAAKVHLHPLRAFAQKDDALIGRVLVAVNEFGQIVGGHVLVAASDLYLGVQRDVLHADGHHHWRARLV